MKLALLRAFGGPSLHADAPALLVRLAVEDSDSSFDRTLTTAWLGRRLPDTGGDAGLPAVVQASLSAARALGQRAGVCLGSVRAMPGPDAGTYDLLVERDPDRAVRALFEACAGAVADLAAGRTPPAADEIAADVSDLAHAYALGPSTRAIVEAAERRNIPWDRLDDASLVRLGWGKHARLIRASTTGQTSSVAVDAACNKPLATRLLRAAQLPVPRGEIVASEEEAVEAAERLGYPVVVKPRDGNHGRGVSVGLSSPEAVASAFAIVRELGRRALVEEQFSGRDFRVLVVGGRVVAAAERRPAQVVGDGRRTIGELTELENADPRRGEGHELPMTRIPLDDVALAHLAAEGRTPADVPAAGETVVICRTANLSRGASAHDVTDELHPSVRSVCERAARAIGLDVCGVDLVAPDLRGPLPAGSGIVEVNAAPGLRMHLYPAEGTPRDVGADIIERLFPDGAPSRVPLIAVTGTNGKTTTTRLIAHGLATDGLNVGMTTSDGIRIGGDEISQGDTTGPASARVVLADPTVEIAVLETARGGIVRRGFGFDTADVAVITNVGEDHVGQDGIRNVDDLYRIKRRVAELVRPGGWLILNADDERLARLPADPAIAGVERRVLFFSTVADSPIIRHHRSRGGRALFTRAGWMLEAAGDRERHLLRLDEAPITMGGAARFQIANLLAACAALRTQGLSPARVVAAARTFRASADNAGRANLYRLGEGYVMLDYGHNPAGYAQVCRLAARWRRDGRRVIGIIGAPGDRPDDTIRASGREAAAGFSRIIVREDVDLRGRAEGEVATLLLEAVREAAPELPCEIVADGVEALRRTLPAVRSGAVAVVFYEHFTPLREVLEMEGARVADAVDDRDASRAGLVVRGGDRLRLGAALLAQPNGERDNRPDGEELALPVLERLEPELRGGDVVEQADG